MGNQLVGNLGKLNRNHLGKKLKKQVAFSTRAKQVCSIRKWNTRNKQMKAQWKPGNI